MSSDIQTKWDAIYSDKQNSPAPSLVLMQNQHLLPKNGTALDLACGLGGNAVLLAKAGLDVSAWDVSPVAIKQLQDFSVLNDVIIHAQVRDVLASPPKPNTLDVLVVSFFLDRDLCSSLFAALRPGGLLFYQTYCQQKVEKIGPNNTDFLLADNELLSLFSTMRLRVYREESLLGEHQQGWRNQAMLVAEK